MAATVGSLRVDLGLNSADFQAGMSKAEAAMSNFGRSAATVGKATEAVGATSARVMARQVNLAFQLQDVGVSLAGGMNPLMVAAQQGSQILGIYGMGQGGLGAALRDLGSMATGLVSKLWPVAAVLGVASAAIAAMTGEINKSAGATVGFGDVALATWQLFAEGVYNLVQPAIAAIGGWFSNLWGMISPAIAAAVNGIIGGFVGAFEAVKATWSALPGALGDLVYQAANATVTSVQYMIRTIQVEINKFLAGIDRGLLAAGMSPTGMNVGAIDITGVANPFSGQAAGVAGAASEAFAGAQKDYLGGLLSAVGERARANIAATKAEVDGLGGSAKAANDNLKGMAEGGLKDLADIGQQVTSTLSSGFSDMFKGLLRGTTNAMDAIGQLLGKLADLFIDQAFNMLFSGGFGGGGGGGFLGGIGKLFGFAQGGSFQVGGSGGIDSQLVAFKASPNETVSVTKPGQERGGGGAISVDVTVGVQDGSLVPLITQVSGQVAGQQIKQNNKQLPSIMQDINMRQG